MGFMLWLHEHSDAVTWVWLALAFGRASRRVVSATAEASHRPIQPHSPVRAQMDFSRRNLQY
jgi:hypothetical protein